MDRRRRLFGSKIQALLLLSLLIIGSSYFSQSVAYHHNSQQVPSKFDFKSHPISIPKRPPQGGGRSDKASQNVNVNALYSAEPAPMGIADFGINSTGAYSYFTNSSLGTATIHSMLTNDSSGSDALSIQLNAVLVFTTATSQSVYWIQNVASLYTKSNFIAFLDNIWNFSARNAKMNASAVSGRGSVYPDGSNAYYAADASDALPGNGLNLNYPVSIELRVNSTINTSDEPTVTFEFNDGYGWAKYDSVSFTKATSLKSMHGFEVNGFNYNPYGTFYDAELVLGGDCCGTATTDLSSNVGFELSYWNGHNYQAVKSAFNFGSDTAETVSGVVALGSYYEGNGTLFSTIRAGAGSLGQLYDSSQVGTIDARSTITSGTIFVYNASDSIRAAREYQFENGEANVTIAPGNYVVLIYEGSSLYSRNSMVLSAGETIFLFHNYTGIILSYSIKGGGSVSPVIYYSYNGLATRANLTTSPTIYFVDPGSRWNVSSTLGGSNASERWITDQNTSGVGNGRQETKFVYYHQYLVTFGYSIIGGGSAFNSPAVSFDYFGAKGSTDVGRPVWADALSNYSFTNPLVGSNSEERWVAKNSSGVIDSSHLVNSEYYNQFSIEFRYNIVGGSSGAIPPVLSFRYLGSPQNQSISSSRSFWIDAGTSWNLPDHLSGPVDALERWETNSTTTTSSVTNSSGEFSFAYYHQYEVSFSYSILDGGNPPAPSLQFSQFGMLVGTQLGLGPSLLWTDAGSAWIVPQTLLGSSATERWFSYYNTGRVDGNSTVVTAYYHQYLIVFAIKGSGTIDPSGSNFYNATSSLEIFAFPESGFLFDSWSSNSSSITFRNSTDPATAALILGAGQVTANFGSYLASSTTNSTSSTTAGNGFSATDLYGLVGVLISLALLVAIVIRRRGVVGEKRRTDGKNF